MEDTDYKTTIIKKANDENIIIYFTSSWCGPCRAMAPVVEQASKLVNIIKVDIDDVINLANEEGIRAVPTFVHYRKGVEVERKVGGMSSDALVELYNS